MPTSEERLHKLQTAASLMNFEYGIRAWSKASLYWGIFTFFVGILGILEPSFGLVASIKANFIIAAVNLLLGFFLIAAGIYQLRSRGPNVVRLSAVTLALLAIWNLGGFLVTLLFGITVGHSFLAGLAHAYGAYSTWRSYGHYVGLLKGTDPGALEETRRWVMELAAGDPNAIKFRRPLSRDDPYWRLRFIDDLALLVRMGGFLARESSARLRAKEVLWLRRAQVQIQSDGDRWSKKVLYATMHLGEGRKEVVRIQADMLERLEMKA